MADYQTIAQILERTQQTGLSIGETAWQDEAAAQNLSAEETFARMAKRWQVMKESVLDGESDECRTASGMTAAEGHRMKEAIDNGTIPNDLFTNVVQKALAVSCSNACMGRIVAAPTAGASGVMPGLLVATQQFAGLSDEAMTKSLFTAGALGMVVAQQATLSGSVGGCQAECGTAAAMGAGAYAELMGGSPQQVVHAFALAIKSSLGLICDPLGSAVEVPCNKRNANYAAVAMASATMALAGVESFIPPDEVVQAMEQAGRLISDDLRNGRGGCAGTPTGQRMAKEAAGE